MIKGMTALSIFVGYIDRTGKMPTKDEFIECGYHRATYYRVKKEYADYLQARINEVAEGGNA